MEGTFGSKFVSYSLIGCHSCVGRWNEVGGVPYNLHAQLGHTSICSTVSCFSIHQTEVGCYGQGLLQQRAKPSAR